MEIFKEVAQNILQNLVIRHTSSFAIVERFGVNLNGNKINQQKKLLAEATSFRKRASSQSIYHDKCEYEIQITPHYMYLGMNDAILQKY